MSSTSSYFSFFIFPLTWYSERVALHCIWNAFVVFSMSFEDENTIVSRFTAIEIIMYHTFLMINGFVYLQRFVRIVLKETWYNLNEVLQALNSKWKSYFKALNAKYIFVICGFYCFQRTNNILLIVFLNTKTCVNLNMSIKL